MCDQRAAGPVEAGSLFASEPRLLKHFLGDGARIRIISAIGYACP